MKAKDLNEKIALLKDGQHVEIDGMIFSAKSINPTFPYSPCAECNVDCLCHGDVAEVCIMLDFMSKTVWYLHLET